MKRFVVTVILALCTLVNFAENKLGEKDKSQIMGILDKQVEAWNEGNLEKFMETYRKSEKLVFVGSRGPTYGWQATLDNYKKGYPDKAAMGKLEFTILDISKIDSKTVFVIGRFELTRKVGDLAGHFTLLIQKIKGNWVIVSDHSSASD
jgi:hypothetical protein